jgi:hypothetical protein
MALAETFEKVLDSLPDDWTDLTLELKVRDVRRYIEAAAFMTTCNAQPLSKAERHFRILVAHRFGHAAAAPTVRGTLGLLDEAGIDGELVVVDVREGRHEIVPGWGRPESARQAFRELRAQ